MAAKEIETILLNSAMPNQRIWTVAPTYSLTDKVFREIWTDLVVGREIDGKKQAPLVHPSAIIKKSENDRIIRMAWGSEVIGKSADRPDSLVGEGLDFLVLDEAAKIKQRIWEKYLEPTLTDRKGDALFITTPEGRNFVHGLYKAGLENLDGEWDSFHFSSYDNPHLDKGTIDKSKNRLTAETFNQEYLALFVTFAGRVYKAFDMEVHVINKLTERFDEVICGIDYGFVNPCAILVIGILDGRFYVIDEVYQSGLLLNEIMTNLKRLKEKYKIKAFYADHKPEYNNPLQKARIYVKNAKKEVAAGIDKVAEMMKIQPDGKPKWFVHSRCSNTITEHENYRYPEEKENQNSKEEPTKHDDHACDANRYAVYSHLRRFKPQMMKADIM
jgi:PBSX family phage terminase large subunit